MEDITLEDLNTEEGQQMIRFITERVLRNQNDRPLAEMHPDDQEVNLQNTYEVFRAFLEISNELRN